MRQSPSSHSLLPARAGMVPGQSGGARSTTPAPRTRGDGPREGVYVQLTRGCSPHARGWSRCRGRRAGRERLLPARAGMVPAKASTSS
ncbi:hypothetical protein E6P78_03105 [Streptomyces sp. A0958]|nr:hypothetical protein E6P78_03105 [Streptomyces sp. A0958]